MKKDITIHCKTSGNPLYQGRFGSFRHCLEHAVKDRVNLKGANLRYRNLSGANLDDAFMDEADFTGANLTGTNLSESSLRACVFTNTNLIDACLSYSTLDESDLRGARFGATDIAGTGLSLCTFSGLSTFSLDFITAASLKNATYIHRNGSDTGQTIAMQSPPLVLYGALHTPVIIFDQEMVIGSQCFPLISNALPSPPIPWLALLLQGIQYGTLT